MHVLLPVVPGRWHSCHALQQLLPHFLSKQQKRNYTCRLSQRPEVSPALRLVLTFSLTIKDSSVHVLQLPRVGVKLDAFGCQVILVQAHMRHFWLQHSMKPDTKDASD